MILKGLKLKKSYENEVPEVPEVLVTPDPPIVL